MKKKKKSSPAKSPYRYYADQAWDCIGCGKCCSMWDIPVTKKEKERIEKLELPGFDFEKEEYFVPLKNRKNLFLIKKKDNKCIFLDDDNLCIMHKLHGEPVKALACRLYPFHVLTWEDNVTSASFRFDCKAVSENVGKKISEQEDQIRRFIPELEKSGRKSNTKFSSTLQPPLNNLREIASFYKEILFDEEFKFSARLHYAARMIDFFSDPGHSGFLQKIEPDAGKENLEYFLDNAEGFEYVISASEPVDKLTKMVFNYIISGYARVDEEAASDYWMLGRVKRANSILRFMIGKGSLHKLGQDYPDTSGLLTFDTMERSVMEHEAKEALKRHAAVQLVSMHFCGNPGLNLTFDEGIRHLILLIPINVAIASLYAATHDKSN
jgi:Fe-S-cluster containining protein